MRSSQFFFRTLIAGMEPCAIILYRSNVCLHLYINYYLESGNSMSSVDNDKDDVADNIITLYESYKNYDFS